jgi:hypothetical protein
MKLDVLKNIKAGQWVVVINNEIIVGKSAKEVYAEAKNRFPQSEPFLIKIPEQRDIML